MIQGSKKHNRSESQEQAASKKPCTTLPLFDTKQKITENNLPLPKLDARKYKLVQITPLNWIIIPRESYIKSTLKCFSDELQKSRGYTITPYTGKEDDFDEDEVNNFICSEEANIKETVETLPFFKDDILPNMEKPGRWIGEKVIERVITLQKCGGLPIACIYFSIFVDLKKCEIKYLSVNINEQGKGGFGPILLQVAIYLSSLYGCSTIYLESTESAKQMYLKHGFFYDNAEDFVWHRYDKLTAQQLNDLESYFFRLDLDNEQALAFYKTQTSKNFQFKNDVKEEINNHLRIFEKHRVDFGLLREFIDSVQMYPNIVMKQRAQQKLEEYAKKVVVPKEFCKAYTILQQPTHNRESDRINLK